MTWFRFYKTRVTAIIVTVVLAGLVVVAIVFVHQRGETARQQEAVKSADQAFEKQKKDEQQDSDEATVAVMQEPTQKRPVSSEKGNQQNTELPKTGIEDVSSIVILGLLTLSIMSYIQSRRVLRTTFDL